MKRRYRQIAIGKLMPNIHNLTDPPLGGTETERASLAFELLLHGKWRLQILSVMCLGPVRLGQLSRRIPGASKKVLAQNLRKLEADGIVVRTDFSNVVLHVEYDFNPEFRDSVCDVLNQLSAWGDQYVRWSATNAKEASWDGQATQIPAIAPPKLAKSADQSELKPQSREQNALPYVTDVLDKVEHMQFSERDSVKVLAVLKNTPPPNAKLPTADRARKRRR